MKTGMLIGLLAVGLALVQAGDTPFEDVVKGMVVTLDDINKTLVGVKDEATAIAAKPDLKKHGERMLDLRKKAAGLLQPAKDEKDRLERLYKTKMEESLKKLREESVRVKSVPGGEDALKEIAVLDDKKKAKE